MKAYPALVAAHAATGYALAVGVEGVLWGDSRWAAVRGVIGWMALAGGVWALHAAFAPSPESRLPKHMTEIAAGTMAVALLLSFTLTPGYRVAIALCLVLGVLYAVPPVRLAGRKGWEPASAAVAFGFLTPYAGFAVTGKPLDLVSGLVLLGFAFLAAGGRALAGAPDAIRAPVLAIWGSAAAFGLWLVAWLLHGDPWYVPAGALLGLVSLGISFAAWTRLLLPRRRRPHEIGDAGSHRRGRWQVGVAWLITDGAVVMALGL